MNRVWLDVETSGLSHRHNDVIQVGAVITDENNNTLGEFESNCRPHNPTYINEESIKIHGITRDTMLAFPEPILVAHSFVEFLESVPGQKTLCGFNVGFDQRFIEEWMYKSKQEGKYAENFQVTKKIYDVFKVASANKKKIGKGSYKLTALCEKFKIKLTKAHNALADIKATIALDNKLMDIIGSVSTKESEFNLEGSNSLIDKNMVYDGKYLAINGCGSVYISEHTTGDPEKMKFILNYLEKLYCSQ